MGEIKEFFKEIWHEIPIQILAMVGYSLLVVLYLINLNKFNHQLESIGGNGEIAQSVNVMLYDGGRAWKYLSLAVVLAALATLLVWFIITHFRYVSGYSMLAFIFFLVLLLIYVCLIIIFINNPILRAAIIVIFCGGILISVLK